MDLRRRLLCQCGTQIVKAASNLFIQPMTNPYSVTGSPSIIGTVTQRWENGEVEDPWPIWHNGQLSIVYSSNDFASGVYALGLMKYNGGAITDARSWPKVAGPIFGGSNPGAQAFGAGTFTSFPSPDSAQTWFAFNAYRRNDYSSDTREVRVQPLSWNADNTPNLGALIPLTTALPLPSGDPGVAAFKGIYPGAWYRVFNQNAQICLDDSGGSTDPGAAVELWTCNLLPPQNWQVLPSTRANGWYKVINQTAGLALDDAAGSTSPGANVDLWIDNFLDTQQWSFSTAGGGYLGVKNRHANLVLDDSGGGVAPGTSVDLWTNLNHLNTQNWLFAPITQSGLFYHIVNLTSQLCVDDAGSGRSPGTIVDQLTCGTGANQNWQLQDMGGGWFRLVNQNSGLCLDDPAGSTSPGTLLQQWTCNGLPPQNWQLVDIGQGYYNFLNQAANLMLDDPAGSTRSGVQLQLWTSNNASPQAWRLVLP